MARILLRLRRTSCTATGDTQCPGYLRSIFKSFAPPEGTSTVTPDLSGLANFAGIFTFGFGYLDGSSIPLSMLVSPVNVGSNAAVTV